MDPVQKNLTDRIAHAEKMREKSLERAALAESERTENFFLDNAITFDNRAAELRRKLEEWNLYWHRGKV